MQILLGYHYTNIRIKISRHAFCKIHPFPQSPRHQISSSMNLSFSVELKSTLFVPSIRNLQNMRFWIWNNFGGRACHLIPVPF